MYRNIFELSSLPETLIGNYDSSADSQCQQVWTEDQVENIPLESDSEAIEYLAMHAFKLEDAVFSVLCEMGAGKGTFSTNYHKWMDAWIDAWMNGWMMARAMKVILCKLRRT